MSLSLALFVSVTIALNLVGQLLLKIGAGRPGIASLAPFSLVNYHTMGGALFFVAALGFYIVTLQRTSLIVAQSLFSLQFAAIVLGASLVLGERLTFSQGAGVALIALGVFLVVRP